jgi:hypothetical protein
MKKFLFLSTFACLCFAQQHQSPKQLSGLKAYMNTDTCLKLVTDPICMPTSLISYYIHNACNLSCPYACVVGTCIACTGLYLATDGDDQQYNYCSVKALAAIKNGLFTAFPCIAPCQTVKKKTE